MTPKKAKSVSIASYYPSKKTAGIGLSPIDSNRKRERAYKGSMQGPPRKAKTGASIAMKTSPTSARKMAKGTNKVTEKTGKGQRAQARKL